MDPASGKRLFYIQPRNSSSRESTRLVESIFSQQLLFFQLCGVYTTGPHFL